MSFQKIHRDDDNKLSGILYLNGEYDEGTFRKN